MGRVIRIGEPYGGKLVNRLVNEKDKERIEREAESIVKIKPHIDAIYDVDKIGIGAYSPLDGFMCLDDVRSVISRGRLSNDLPWTIPIIMAPPEKKNAGVVSAIAEGDEVALLDTSDQPFALMHVEDKFELKKKEFAKSIYGTLDMSHPNVRDLSDLGGIALGGKIDQIKRLDLPVGRFELTPAETRKTFEENEWRTIAAYQCRNPPHTAHEYIQRCSLEIVDGLHVHPVVGRLKKGDYRPEIIMKAYDAVLRKYYRPDRILLSSLSISMRYGGPKAALFLAIVRKNYGATHFIVGRDLAGVKDANGRDFYDPYECHRIFDEYDVGIIPLKYSEAFYCKACGWMASSKTCPHDTSQHVSTSQTKIREMLRDRKKPPMEILRPEVAEILSDTNIFVD
nr:sulfate adenylyltransferase [Candidatus Njordarchaeum guaymaensis]